MAKALVDFKDFGWTRIEWTRYFKPEERQDVQKLC